MKSVVCSTVWIRRAVRGIVLLAVSALLCAGVAVGVAADDRSAETENEIKKIIRNFADAYQKKDIYTLMGLYAPGNSVIAIGVNKEYIGVHQIEANYKADFVKIKDIEPIDYKIVMLNYTDTVAWLAADGFTSAVKNGKTVSVYGRFTVVLQKVKGHWFLMLTHFSYPAESS